MIASATLLRFLTGLWLSTSNLRMRNWALNGQSFQLRSLVVVVQTPKDRAEFFLSSFFCVTSAV
jgi:hypothetical protein